MGEVQLVTANIVGVKNGKIVPITKQEIKHDETGHVRDRT